IDDQIFGFKEEGGVNSDRQSKIIHAASIVANIYKGMLTDKQLIQNNKIIMDETRSLTNDFFLKIQKFLLEKDEDSIQRISKFDPSSISGFMFSFAEADINFLPDMLKSIDLHVEKKIKSYDSEAVTKFLLSLEKLKEDHREFYSFEKLVEHFST